MHQEGNVLGYLQSRTEAVEWGLAEIIWVLDADLKLNAFRFQRCRSRHRIAAEAESVQAHLKGLSEADLLRIQQEEGPDWLVKKAGLPESAVKLADAILKSGLKACGLARVVWGEDIATSQNTLGQRPKN